MENLEGSEAIMEGITKSFYDRLYKRLSIDYQPDEYGILAGSYANESGRRFLIKLYPSSYEEDLREPDLVEEELPSGFEYPFIEISDDDNMKTSQYGDLPTFVIGSDGKLYLIGNQYVINSAGKALKLENIAHAYGDSLEESLQDWELKLEDVAKLDFTPQEKTRFASLDPEDYEKIGWILNQLENDELFPSEYDFLTGKRVRKQT